MSDQRYEFYIAGVQHHKAHQVLKELEVYMELALFPELEERVLKYDASAIQIRYVHKDNPDQMTMLGYVPMKFSSMVTAFMTVNDNVCCTITELDVMEKPWKQIKVVIEEKEDA